MRLLLISILPFITLALGLVSTFIDVKKSRAAAIAILVMMVMSTLGTLVMGYEDYKDKQAEANQSARERAEDQSKIQTLLSTSDSNAKTIAALVGTTSTIKGATADVAAGMAVLLKRFGYSAGREVSPAALETSLAADKAYNQLLPMVQNETQSSPRVVTYFPKGVDAATVLEALKRGNFQVRTGRGNPANANLPTNAVWVGDSLSLADAKFVAATLIRAGVPIVSVRRLKNGSTTERTNLVEVGTDASLAHQAPMNIDQLNSLTEQDLRR